MHLTALMQVTRLGCEMSRSKERPTNTLMNNFNTYMYFFTLNEAKITFQKGENKILKFDLTFTDT